MVTSVNDLYALSIFKQRLRDELKPTALLAQPSPLHEAIVACLEVEKTLPSPSEINYFKINTRIKPTNFNYN